jgi:hypothetical protein
MQHVGPVLSCGQRGARWARVLILGMVCGGVQIFLLLATGMELTPYYAGLPLHWPWVVSLFGGWIGGVVSQWTAPRSIHSSPLSAPARPPEEALGGE